jgi:hypothetical protein
MRIVVCAIIGLLLTCDAASAWGYKEHIQLTRLAVMRLAADPATPASLSQWLTQTTPTLASMDEERHYFMTARVGITPDPKSLRGLTWWVCVPDLDANDTTAPVVEPFGVRELPLHFIDLEFFKPGEGQTTYRDDLSMLPARGDVPRDRSDPRFVRAGMLPFSVEWAYGNLVRCLKEGRLDVDPARAEDADHAVRWAGVLSHYVQDNTQPHHSTIDYRSHSYLDVASPPSAHSEMEWRMADDETQPNEGLRARYWDELMTALDTPFDPATTNDVWLATLDVSIDAYRHLPLIGRSARAALRTDPTTKPTIDTDAFFRHLSDPTDPTSSALTLKARQQGLAVRRTARLIRQAWIEAGR